MTGAIRSEPTTVPIARGEDVRIEPGMPWPSAYRGSQYSVIESRRHKQTVLQWKYKDLVVVVDPPATLEERLQKLGKSQATGRGSVRVTAAGEVLTKIHSDNYENSHRAPVEDGWVPVYVGKLEGDYGVDIELDPDVQPETVDVWSGFPFKHGESWAVGYDGTLVWKWRDYRFESAFEHPELVEAYESYRTIAGRLYINEFGHIFVNAPRDEVPERKAAEFAEAFANWERAVEQRGDTAAKRLVTRRLKVTGGGDPDDGHLPLYIGHLSEFDDGLIPKPVVDDETYFVAASRGENLDDY